MSNEELVKVNCHHSGQFKEANGVCDYIDGVVDVFEIHPDAIFKTVIAMKLLDKDIEVGTMWYKLPFEDLAEKHSLGVEANSNKMQSAGRWMRELDVYIEKPVRYSLVGNDEAIPDELSDGEGDPEYEPEGETDDDADEDEDGLSENAESEEEDEVGEADLEVFNHDNYEEQIPDEDEVYPAKFWEEVGGRRIYGPPYKRPPGRPKGKARIKGLHESPTKKNKYKVGRKGRIAHCSLCGGAGHNSRKCPNESNESRAKRRKLAQDAQNAALLEAQDEAEMEAAMIAQEEAALGGHEEAGTSGQGHVEFQDVSSTAPQGSQRLRSLLFGNTTQH